MKCEQKKHACIICLAVLSSLLNFMRGGSSDAAGTFSGVVPEVENFLVGKLNTAGADWFPKLRPL